MAWVHPTRNSVLRGAAFHVEWPAEPKRCSKDLGFGVSSQRTPRVALVLRNPVLYLKDPPGIERSDRRRMLDRVAALNRHLHEETVIPKPWPAFSNTDGFGRMQTSVPELVELMTKAKNV